MDLDYIIDNLKDILGNENLLDQLLLLLSDDDLEYNLNSIIRLQGIDLY